jgi:density-regulated protein DRP1
MTTLSVEAQERADKDARKKEARAQAQESKEAEMRATSKVIIKRVERNKRKFVTSIQGLELFGLDLKKTAKIMATKFATGSSVTKMAGGGEEITVQGDVSGEIEEYILDNFKQIPEDNVELIEEKKKKV